MSDRILSTRGLFLSSSCFIVSLRKLVIFQAFLYKSTYSLTLRISNIYLHWIVVVLKTEGEVVVDLEHKRIKQMVTLEH